LVGFARKPRHAQIPETGLATSDRGPLPAQRAILILGAEPVGQPSPDTITTAVRLAPRPPLVLAVEAVVSGIGLGSA
jgi:hypothetical protein